MRGLRQQDKVHTVFWRACGGLSDWIVDGTCVVEIVFFSTCAALWIWLLRVCSCNASRRMRYVTLILLAGTVVARVVLGIAVVDGAIKLV